jgi:iron complex transport system substrate-binding protein
MRRLIVVLLALLVVLKGASASLLKDFLGRSVEIKEAKKIVAIGPGALRLLFYLKAQDLVCGIEETEKLGDPMGKDYSMTRDFDLIKALPVIGPGGPGKPPIPELIAKANPDLIIMSSVLTEVYDPDRLQKETGKPVLVISLGPAGQVDMGTLNRTFKTLGVALKREERANELIKYLEGYTSDLSNRTKDLKNRPKVYVGAVSFKGSQPFTATQSPYPPLTWLNTASFADKYARTAGFLNLDFEVFLKEQPQVIFIDEGNLNLVKQDFSKDPGKYCLIEAFKKGEIYGVLPFNYYWTNISTALSDAYYIGKVLYPERFKDVDAIKKANEIFKVFVGEPLYEKFLKAYPGFVNLKTEFKCQ